MAILNVYLYFNGNCELAFDFYKSIFGGEYEFIGRYKNLSEQARQNFPDCTDDQIMHITLPISKETVLMGSDLIRTDDETSDSKSGFSLYINTESQLEADRIFNALSEEGDIMVPIDNQFWGSYYGLCIDKFGVSWKVSYSAT